MVSKKALEVVVIEHNSADRALLESLSAYGKVKWHFTFHGNGAAAARSLFPRRGSDAPVPDLIVLGTDGADEESWELLRRLRISHRLRGVPAVILSRSQEPGIVERAKRLDVPLLPKPRTRADATGLVERIEWFWRSRAIAAR